MKDFAIAAYSAMVILFLSGCSHSIPISEREPTRQNLNAMVTSTLVELSEHDEGFEDALATASGYFVAEVANVKGPLIGAGGGLGVLYDRANDYTTYIDVEHYDVGIGLGKGSVRVLTLFQTKAELDAFKQKNTNISGSTEYRGIGDDKITIAPKYIDDYEIPVYYINDSGKSVNSVRRAVSFSVNEELSDVGVSEYRVPAKAMASPPQHKEWERILPFYGQKVIDLGYDLPLPIGISLIYSDTFQSMEISDLEIGFNGGDKTPMTFVGFGDNSSDSKSPQLKVDAWVLPFMNVFVSVGQVSGDATVHFGFDGDQFIEQSGLDCRKPINKPLCDRLEGNQSVPIRVDVDFSGVSYTLGTVLAGGWNDYFVAIPLNVTYADMSSSDTYGLVYSTSPRFGKTFKLSPERNIAVYTGASYLDSSLTIAGTHYFPDGANVDYKIKQDNTTKWAGIVGANLNINRYWSLGVEYTGFVGDREQFIMNFNRRF